MIDDDVLGGAARLDVLPARKNDVLAEICRAIVRGGSPRELVQECTQRLQRYFRTASVGLWFQDDGDIVLEGLCVPDEHEETVSPAIRRLWSRVSLAADLPVPRAMRARSTLRWRADDAELAPDVRQVLAALNTHWLVTMPVFVDSEVVGGVGVATAEEQTLSAADELLLDSALGVIAIVYRRAVLQELERDHQRKALQAYHMAAVGELAAGVAHEVNNPLASIMNFAELVLSEGPPEPVLEWAAAILGEARRAADSMEHLRLFAQPGGGQPRPVRPETPVQEAFAIMGAQLEREGIRLDRTTETGVPPVEVDPSRLRHVVQNILVNARQAMESDEAGRIHVEIRRVGTMVEITFEDTGPGMSASVREAVFRPFFTTRKAREGTGMGLALAYSLVTEAGGEIIAGNWGHPRVEGGVPGAGGARIVVRLPGTSAENGPEAPTAGGPTTTLAPPPNLRVLIVEDEEAVARPVATYLARSGSEVDVAGTAEEALRRIRVARSPYDAIISDLRMPGMGGEGLFREIRDHHPDLLPRLVLTSGDVVSGDTARLMRECGRPFLRKPYPLEELAAVLREVVGAAD